MKPGETAKCWNCAHWQTRSVDALCTKHIKLVRMCDKPCEDWVDMENKRQ